jgi:hypothetical protein
MGVTAELHARVLRRDTACFIYLYVDRQHICADRWNRSHSPYELAKLTVDHVKDEPMMGVRAPDDERHLVAMCWRGNVGVPSKAVRAAEREYLAAL